MVGSPALVHDELCLANMWRASTPGRLGWDRRPKARGPWRASQNSQQVVAHGVSRASGSDGLGRALHGMLRHQPPQRCRQDGGCGKSPSRSLRPVCDLSDAHAGQKQGAQHQIDAEGAACVRP